MTERACAIGCSILFFTVTLSSHAGDSERSTSVKTAIFNSHEVISFYITIQPEDWDKMQPKRQKRLKPPPPGANPGFRPPPPGPLPGRSGFEYIKGTVRYRDEIYPDVGIRFKGNSSFWGFRRGLKKPYKFDFDRFVANQTFHGYKKLNFSNGFKDASLMREKLAYDLFQKTGIPAPHAVYAKLYLTVERKYNQEYLGLYTMIEQVNKRFLTDRFGNGGGLLVKPDGIPDLADLGANWKMYERYYELKSSKKTSDTARLIQFIKFLNDADNNQFAQEVEGLFNVDVFLRFLAVNALLVNLDSYMGTGHNYYLYHNAATGRYEMIPWDLNEAFGNFQMGSAQQMLDLDINQPSGGRKILIERLLRIEKYKAQYHQHLMNLTETHFRPDTMHAEIDWLYALIHDAVAADKHKQFSTEWFERSISENIRLGHRPGLFERPTRQAQPGAQGGRKAHRDPRPPPPQPMLEEIIGLKPFVVKRVESVTAQLRGEKRGYIIKRFGSRRPKRQQPKL